MRTASVHHPEVVDLDDPRARDAALVGGKAATLATLRASGQRVPDGLVALPAADAEGAAAAVVQRFGEQAVAVRSSAQAEDLAAASYAGQYRTVLGVHGATAIAGAIRDVRASIADAADRGYGVAGANEMPVLIMPMVEAAAAGVAFTSNPVTGDDEIIVEAVRGLGEALVAGTVTPQRFVIEHDGGTEAEPGGEDAITAQQALEVATLARNIAEQRGAPQDIEWAIAGGMVHLLQARPITALPVAPQDELPGPREIWQRADENYAYPVRPLEFSVWAPRLEETSTKVFAEVGAPLEAMRYRLIGGWMYTRFIPTMDQGKDDQAAPPAFLMGVAMRTIPALRRRLHRAAEVWCSDLGTTAAEDWEHGGREAMRARTRELVHTDRAALDDTRLADHFEAVLRQLQAASDVHFRLPVLATFLPTGHLGVLVERLLGWEPGQVLQLLQGYSTVGDAADALDRVAAAIAGDPAATQLLRDAPTRLVDSPGPAGDALRAYLEEHGRKIVGMDLAHPTWAEDPRPVLTMLQARVGRKGRRPDARAAADELERQARAALAGRPHDLAAFTAALARARRGVSYGDDTESDVLQVLGLVRYAAMEAGRRLARAGALAQPDDVLFCTERELLEALRGQPLTGDIARRRAEFRWAQAHPGPRRYGPQPPPEPSMRWAPRAARPFLEAMMWAMGMAAGGRQGAEPPTDGTLRGTPASPGRATGTVRIIRDPSEFDRIQPDDVLVCPCTIAAWSVVFPLVCAVVTEVGGPLSHPGILAREFGIPAVLSVTEATTRLHEGQVVTVDGSTGRVVIADLRVPAGRGAV